MDVYTVLQRMRCRFLGVGIAGGARGRELQDRAPRGCEQGRSALGHQRQSIADPGRLTREQNPPPGAQNAVKLGEGAR